MVYLLGVIAAACLGIGWVLQLQVAAAAGATGTSRAVLARLIRNRTWWGGIAAMTLGQTLAAVALQAGPVTIVEPLLVICLLFAFGFVARQGRHRVRRRELLGTLLVMAGLAVFLAVAHPRAADLDYHPPLPSIALAGGIAAGAAGACVVIAWWVNGRYGPPGAAAAVAAAAGILYALQDASTRGWIVVSGTDGIVATLHTTWPYLVLAAATVAVLLSQYSFRPGRLDVALPPTAAAQPLAGIGLGIFALDDRISITVGSIWLEAAGLGLVLLGVVVVGRSHALTRAHVQASGSR